MYVGYGRAACMRESPGEAFEKRDSVLHARMQTRKRVRNSGERDGERDLFPGGPRRVYFPYIRIVKPKQTKTMNISEQQRIENMKTANIWVFVNWEPQSFENIKGSRTYVLWEKSITDPGTLTREEKDWLAAEFVRCSVTYGSGNVICLGGWAMRFPTARKFLVNYKYDGGTWHEKYAFDKTSLRKALYQVNHIMEFPGGE